MKIQKQFLDLEDDEGELVIGLAKLVKPIADYELFFHINKLNGYQFSRTEDILIHRKYHDYYFTKFEAYHPENKTCIKFISNRSVHSVKKTGLTELFSDEENVMFFLKKHQDIDYIVSSFDAFPNFSLFLQPKGIMFKIQQFSLSPDEELYNVIQYYE